MNPLKKVLAVVVMSLALTFTAFAGEIPTGVTGEIPTGVTQTTSANDASTGKMPGGVTSDVDPVTEVLINVLNSILTLF